jgi:5-methylcytosine-specific restriction endonuclease McrBC regulatory subunit McrC
LADTYLTLLNEELIPLIPQGLTAAIYTQITEAEIEIKGYLSYDRKVKKMNAKKIHQAHVELGELFR